MLVGSTGVFKSETAALAQQFYGSGFIRTKLPASFGNTGYSNQQLAFLAKDMLLTIDDLAPAFDKSFAKRLGRDAEHLIRSQGNASGRARLTSDGQRKEADPSRGIILITGEDLPSGASIRARLLVLTLRKGDVAGERLSLCQADAAKGMYARSTAAFITWVASRLDRLRGEWVTETEQLRAKWSGASHARIPTTLAMLDFVLRVWLKFVSDSGASPEWVAGLGSKLEKGLVFAAGMDCQEQHHVDPVEDLFEAISSGLAAGTCHLRSMSNSSPADPRSMGWEPILVGGSLQEKPRGRHLGWVEGKDMFLIPRATADWARANEITALSVPALGRLLHEAKRLVRREDLGGTNTVRVTIAKNRLRVWHIRASDVFPVDPPAVTPAAEPVPEK